MLNRLAALLLLFGVGASLAAAWLLRDAPLALAGGLLRADALSALFALVTAGLALAELIPRPTRSDELMDVFYGEGQALSTPLPARHGQGLSIPKPLPGELQLLAAAGLLAAAYLSGHLAIMAVLFALAGLLRVFGRRPSEALPVALPMICLALGLASLGLRSGEWRYGEPGAGAGLNSGAFVLLLLAAALAGGLLALVDGRSAGPGRQIDPLLGPALLYPLLRLDSLGPWNLGWLAATLLIGSATALWSAWQAATDAPGSAAAWLQRYLIGLALVGAGLGSGAGLALAAFALLSMPLIALGMGAAAGVERPWPLWALSAATPLSAPFVAAWVGVSAATAGRVPALATALWAAALLAAVPVARLAAGGGGRPRWPQDRWLLLAAGLSMALGIGAPLALGLLVAPMVSQLAGGLSPMGEIALWPWAGLIALDAARQPVAGLPTLAMAGLMIVLAALAWIGARLLSRRDSSGEG